MPVRVACVKCNKTFTLKDEYAGRKIRCPECQAIIQVPAINGGSDQRITPKRPATSQVPQAATLGSARPQRTPSVVQDNRARATMSKDSDATVTMRALPAMRPGDSQRVTPPQAPSLSCPSCGRSVPANEQACPFCRYHFKLKRKIGLSQAIHSANMHSQGLNTDGSKKITQAELTEDRVEEQKKVGKVMVAVMTLVVLALLGGAALIIHNALQAPSIADMRETIKPPAIAPQKPETFHPLRISISEKEKITVRIPVDHIFALTPEFPKPWPQGTAAWAAFAQTVMPPLAVVGERLTISPEAAAPLIKQADLLGGNYTPQALQTGAPQGEVQVWRENGELRQGGSLRGAILDFGKEGFRANEITAARQQMAADEAKRQKRIKEELATAAAFGKKMTQEEAAAKFPPVKMAEVEITGRLSMLPFYDHDLQGGMGSYRFSAENGSPNVRNPDNVAEAKDRPAENRCYFAPVLLVSEVKVVQPGVEKKR